LPHETILPRQMLSPHASPARLVSFLPPARPFFLDWYHFCHQQDPSFILCHKRGRWVTFLGHINILVNLAGGLTKYRPSDSDAMKPSPEEIGEKWGSLDTLVEAVLFLVPPAGDGVNGVGLPVQAKGREAGVTSSPSLIWSDNQPPAETVSGFGLQSNLRDAAMLEKGGAVMFDKPPPYHNSVHIPQRADIVERISPDANEIC